MTSLELNISNFSAPELLTVQYRSPQMEIDQYSTRGRSSLALPDTHTFQWSKAVHAFTILLVRAARFGLKISVEAQSVARLEGLRGSPAASLDYALAKQPIWLLDMFGVLPNGMPTLKRLFVRVNPEGKRPGPVFVALNYKFLPYHSISVWVDGAKITNPEQLLEIEQRLLASWDDNVKSHNQDKANTLNPVALKQLVA